MFYYVNHIGLELTFSCLRFPSSGRGGMHTNLTFSALAAFYSLLAGMLVRREKSREVTIASHFAGDRFTADPGMTCGSTDLK